MGTISDKSAYLNTTKTLLREKINDLGQDLDEEDTFRSYVEALEEVWNEYPKVTATDVTEATLEGTKAGKMKLDIKGNSTQETTEGNQLFDIGTSITKRYINRNTGNVGTSNGWSATDFIPIEENTAYTFSGITNSTSDVAGTAFYDENKTFISAVTPRIYTFTTPANSKYMRISLTSENPVGVMVNAGSTALPYEPYTGGLPSPNPSYPVDINSAGIKGNAELPNEYIEIEYIKSTKTQYIDLNYNPTNSTDLELTCKFDNITNNFTSSKTRFLGTPNSTIRFNFGTSAGQDTTIFFWTKSSGSVPQIDVKNTIYKKNTIKLKGTKLTYGEHSLTLTRNQSTTNSISLFGIIDDTPFNTYDMYVYSMKVWEGDTLVRNLIPCYRKSDNEIGLYDLVNNVFYTNQGTGSFIKGNVVGITEKIVNKNLYNKATTIEGYRLGGDGLPYADSTYALSDFIKVSPSTNYIFNRLTNGFGSSAICYYKANKEFISRTFLGSTGASFNITTASNVGYVRITDSKAIMSSNIQLEQGSTATTYVAHQEQTFILPVQQPIRDIKLDENTILRDKFIRVSGNWYERHNVGRILCVGAETEEYTRERYGELYTRFYLVKSDMLNTLADTRQIVDSNYFRFASSGSDIGSIFRFNNNIYMYPDKTIIDTVEDFKTWLSTHNTEIIYPLATAVDLPCTTAQSQALEQIYKAKSYDGVTHVYSEDGVPIYFVAEALKSN